MSVISCYRLPSTTFSIMIQDCVKTDKWHLYYTEDVMQRRNHAMISTKLSFTCYRVLMVDNSNYINIPKVFYFHMDYNNDGTKHITTSHFFFKQEANNISQVSAHSQR